MRLQGLVLGATGISLSLVSFFISGHVVATPLGLVGIAGIAISALSLRPSQRP
jgi:hypothetical protein